MANGSEASEVIVRELACELTADEVAQAADRAAEASYAIERLEQEFEDVKAEHKGEVKAKQAIVRAGLLAVRTRTVRRDVRCEIRKDFERNAVVTVRLDTC